jgi:hypothetical protein
MGGFIGRKMVLPFAGWVGTVAEIHERAYLKAILPYDRG